MRYFIGLVVLTTLLAACGRDKSVEIEEQVTYTIDASRISVSGLSAGAYMAGQLHVAHSGLFNGAALIAGGPYWCAQGSIKLGLGPCMNGEDIVPNVFLGYAREAESAGKIDSLDNLADDPIWLFHGASDDIVNAKVPAAAATFYESVAGSDQITSVNDVDVVHGFPTLETGTSCDQMATPFLNACGYDAAGELLQALHGKLKQRTDASGELRVVPQPGSDDAEMLDNAFLYVPAACAAGEACGVHVVLHGCQQSAEFVSDAFAAGAGYNQWAEANKLLVLYPQVASSKIAPLNPLGCWDWWGYTSENYATREAPQIKVIKATIDAIAGREL